MLHHGSIENEPQIKSTQTTRVTRPEILKITRTTEPSGWLSGLYVMQKSFREKVKDAWKDMEPPFRISGSDEGDEPYLLEKEFEDRPKWEDLKHEFLDNTPDGFGSALSFFADEAFRYYVAAYMVAELEKQLDRVDVVFSLTYGLDNESKGERERVSPIFHVFI